MSVIPNYQTYETEWLRSIKEGNPSTVELGRRFAAKLVGQWLDFENLDSEDDVVYCDGSGDGGIDLACLIRGDGTEENSNEGDAWYLVQSKYGSAFAGSGTIIIEAQKVIETLDGKRPRLSSLSADLVDRLLNFKAKASEKDKIVLVFATQTALTDAEKRALNDVKAMGKERLGPQFEVDAVCIETIYNRLKESSDNVPKLKIAIAASVVPSGEELLVGSVELLRLFEFLKTYRETTGDLDMLYEKNVRKFLGNRRKVNKGIEQTLVTMPERFGLYNNGITIVVNDFKQLTTSRYELTEPYVVNGCQTTKTIWEVLTKKLESGGTGSNVEIEQWRARVEKGIVVIKIVRVGNQGEDLLTETTRYTNSQNAVTEKDFLALESDFRKWAKGMAKLHSVFLEIQRGGWDSQRAFQKQNPDTPQFAEYINAFDILKIYGAGWLSEPGLSFGKNPPFAPGGSIFHRIVNQPAFGLDDLYAAYILHRAALGYKFGRGAEKKQRTQTRYLYYFVFVELLKDCFIAGSIPISSKGITQAIIELSKPENSDALNALLSFSIEVIDDYLTPESDYSLFKEPRFLEMGSDLNTFLKSEQIGKSNESSPNLINLLAQYKIALKGGIANQPKFRDRIRDIIIATGAPEVTSVEPEVT